MVLFREADTQHIHTHTLGAYAQHADPANPGTQTRTGPHVSNSIKQTVAPVVMPTAKIHERDEH